MISTRGSLAAPAVWVLALTLFLVQSCCVLGHDLPELIEIGADNYTDTIHTIIANDYDWLMLECYAHWCPACKAFQPTYVEIAAHMAARGSAPPRIAVARIDCANKGNEAVCNDFEVKGYPSMFLGTPEKMLARKITSDIHALQLLGPRTKENVINAIASKLKISHAQLLESSPTTTSTIATKEAKGNESDEQAAVVESSTDEKNEKKKEKEEGIAANLRIVKPHIAFADVNDLEGATIKAWEYATLPSLLKGADARAALDKWIALLAHAHPVQACRKGAERAGEALIDAWPASNPHAVYPTDLRNVQICGGSAFTEWSGCRGSLPGSRGYTCALWELLHSLAANLPEPSSSSSSNSRSGGAVWMEATRGFIQHFFQCSDCARNFIAHATSAESLKVQSKREAVLWLWSTHNLVNARLKKEEEDRGAGDPHFPKVQWPSVAECSACHRNSDSSDSSSTENEWDEDEVYEYLLNYYLSGKAQNSASHGGAGGGGGSEVAGIVVGGGGGGGAVNHHSGFTDSWMFALMLLSSVVSGCYFALQRSGLYAIRKAMSRHM